MPPASGNMRRWALVFVTSSLNQAWLMASARVILLAGSTVSRDRHRDLAA